MLGQKLDLGKCTHANLSMFLKPEYGKFGLIILPTSFVMVALVLLLLLGGIPLVVLTVADPGVYLLKWAL